MSAGRFNNLWLSLLFGIAGDGLPADGVADVSQQYRYILNRPAFITGCYDRWPVPPFGGIAS
ncbi:hypothetical protein I8F96_14530 [Enterococcus casseliflavus]|nr:hypothetical protein [Enterococcus casseliflavus]